MIRAGVDHAQLLSDFFRVVWDPASTPETVVAARLAAATANPHGRGREIPTFLFLIGDRAVGHLTTIPARLWDGTQLVDAHHLKGLMVLPEHRNGPIGFLLVKAAVAELGPLLSMVVQSAPRRLFAHFGFHDLGAVPNWLRLLAPGRVAARVDLEALGLRAIPTSLHRPFALAQQTGLARVGGAVAGGAISLWTGMRGGHGLVTATLAPGALPAGEIDVLWLNAGADIAAAGNPRDGAYLDWRYRDGGEATYQCVTARRDGQLVGLAVVRQPRSESDGRLRGLRIATLADMLVHPDDAEATLATLDAAECCARALDADALLATASHGSLEPLLRRRAYLKLPGNVHCMIRGGPDALSRALPEWWLFRGDGDADEVF